MNDSPRYKTDAQGRLVPVETIAPIDLERDALVIELMRRAKLVSEQIADFKRVLFGDFDAFLALSAEQYGAKLGGRKGNVTLFSFDGRYKIIRQIQDSLVFDERLQAAKSLIDECITDWAQGSRPEIRALVNDAFQVDKAGRINVQRVLGLKRLKIEDEKWRAAMQAIADSVHISSSKSYIRFYERVGDTEVFRPVTLDLAQA